MAAKRGPPKTPTNILEARGSWRAKTRKGEPQARKGRPICPAWLLQTAKTVWKVLIPQLDDMGILTLVDRNALTRYCQTHAKWRAAEEFCIAHGDVYPVKDKDGHVTKFEHFPQYGAAIKLNEQLNRMDQYWGLTPSARAGLNVGTPEKRKAGKLAKFTGRKQA